MVARDEAQINTRVTGSARVQRTMDALSRSMGKFRDQVGRSSRVINTLGNAIAVLFRRLARIRTAFFILVTFLALRPIADFFTSLGDFSAKAEAAILRLTNRFRALARLVGDAAVPVIDEFNKSISKAAKDFINFLGDPGTLKSIGFLEGALRKAGQIINIIFQTLKAGFNNFLTLMNSLDVAVNAILFGWVKIVQGLVRAVRTFFDSTFTGKLADELGKINKGLREQGLSEGLSPLFNLELTLRQFSTTQQVAQRANPLFSLINTKLGEFDTLLEGIGKSAGGEVKKNFGDLLERLEKIPGTINDVIFAFEGLDDKTKTTIADAVQAFVEVAQRKMGEKGGIGDVAAINFADSFKDGLQRVVNKGALSTRVLTDIFQDFFTDLQSAMEKGLEDSLVLVFKGKLDDIREILNAFLEDIQRALARSTSRQLVSALIGSLPSIPGLGFLSSPTAGPQAEGGTTFGPSFRLFGERGPEAAIPIKGGKIPVDFTNSPRGGTGGGNTFIFPSLDAASFAGFLQKNRGTLDQFLAEGFLGRSETLRSAVRTVR